MATAIFWAWLWSLTILHRHFWDDIMREALRAKFEQHPKLRSLLLATGDAALVEHTRNDRYWADAGDGTGKNRLGQLLMELREQLRRAS